MTNLPSVIVHNHPRLDRRLPIRVPTPVGLNMRMTRSAVRVVGRWLPGIGWGMLAYDVIQWTRCYRNCNEADDAAQVRRHVPVGQVSSVRLPGQFGTIQVGDELNALDYEGEMAAWRRGERRW